MKLSLWKINSEICSYYVKRSRYCWDVYWKMFQGRKIFRRTFWRNFPKKKKKKIKRKLSMVRRGIGKIVSFRLCLHSIVSLSLHCFCRLLVTKTIVNKRTINSSSTRHADTIGENSNTTSSLSPCLVHGEVWKFLNFHWMEKIVNISILNQEFEFDKFLELLCFDGWYTKSAHI